MTTLVAGLALFIALHLTPFIGRKARSSLRGSIGHGPYVGLFSLLSLGSFVLMVLGWKAADINIVYVAPAWGRSASYLLTVIGLVLFITSTAPTNIRRWLRHPQLIGVSLWGVGHLLANGESRSIVLFGGMTLFSLLAMALSNRRDAVWEKIDPVAGSKNAVVLVIGLIVSAALYYFHGAISGIPLR